MVLTTIVGSNSPNFTKISLDFRVNSVRSCSSSIFRSESHVFTHADKSNLNLFRVRSKFDKVRSINIVGLAIAHAS
jgi:hypothetical protein